MADATMDDVVRRLTIHSAHYPDLRVLLAAYQLVREERDRLHERLAANSGWAEDDDEMFIDEYKLAGPSPKAFRRRPRVSIDGRDIREVVDDAAYGCTVVLANGARVNVTSFSHTVKNHMVSCVSPAARRAYLRHLSAAGYSAEDFSRSNTLRARTGGTE